MAFLIVLFQVDTAAGGGASVPEAEAESYAESAVQDGGRMHIATDQREQTSQPQQNEEKGGSSVDAGAAQDEIAPTKMKRGRRASTRNRASSTESEQSVAEANSPTTLKSGGRQRKRAKALAPDVVEDSQQYLPPARFTPRALEKHAHEKDSRGEAEKTNTRSKKRFAHIPPPHFLFAATISLTKFLCRPRQKQSSSPTQLAKKTKTESPPPTSLPCILFTGIVDPKREKLVVNLGGKVADSIDTCTHLVGARRPVAVLFLSVKLLILF